MSARKLWGGLVALLLVGLSSGVMAFEVRPLVHYLDLESAVVSSTIRVRNSGTDVLPIEISSYRLELRDGHPVVGAPADEILLVFPPAALIQPGASQIVRLQWVPTVVPVQDQSFLVVMEQLPLDNNNDNGLQMLLAFNAVVHMKAPGSQPQWAIVNRVGASEGSLPSLEIGLNNKGNGNAFGSNISLVLVWGSESRVISPYELANYAPDLFLPPGHTRTFEVPWPDWPTDIDHNDIRVEVRYQQ